MNENGILHLTVNASGQVSLWDTPAAALSGKEEEEIYFQLVLTTSQIRLVLRVEALARERKRSQSGV